MYKNGCEYFFLIKKIELMVRFQGYDFTLNKWVSKLVILLNFITMCIYKEEHVLSHKDN